MVAFTQKEAKALEALAANPAYLEVPLVVALCVVRLFTQVVPGESYVLDNYLQVSEEEKLEVRAKCLKILQESSVAMRAD